MQPGEDEEGQGTAISPTTRTHTEGAASSGRSPGTWETCIHHRFPRALSVSALLLSLKHLVLCFLFLDRVPDSLC